MILGDGLVAIVSIALMAYCVFDVIRTDPADCQNLPKLVWLLLVIVLGPIGSIAWLLLGRPPRTSFDLRSTAARRTAPAPEPPAPPAPDPDEFRRRREEALRRYEAERELAKREEELRQREEELRRREQDLGGTNPV